MEAFVYALASVIVISLVSFIGLITLSISVEKLRKIVLYLVSFAAGALMGDVFIHLLPEIVSEHGFTLQVSSVVLFGIVFSLAVEKIIHWRHSHMPGSDHAHPIAIMNLVGDGVHNFIDGLIIGASYLVSVPVGLATTVAVFLHEIPQEIGDFGVLIHGGFSKGKALFMNFLLSLTAVLGVIASFFLSSVDNLSLFLIPFAAGTFLYIAGSDLIPELHKEVKFSKSALQIIFFVLGVSVMFALLLFD